MPEIPIVVAVAAFLLFVGGAYAISRTQQHLRARSVRRNWAALTQEAEDAAHEADHARQAAELAEALPDLPDGYEWDCGVGCDRVVLQIHRTHQGTTTVYRQGSLILDPDNEIPEDVWNDILLQMIHQLAEGLPSCD